jgi:hypothetical protein
MSNLSVVSSSPVDLHDSVSSHHYQNENLKFNNSSLSSRIAQLETISRTQQAELLSMSKTRLENANLKQKIQSLHLQQQATMSSLAAAQTESYNLQAELHALMHNDQQNQLSRQSLQSHAAALRSTAAALSIRSDSLQDTIATQQRHLAADIVRRQDIARMLQERAEAAADVATLRSRKAWHMGGAPDDDAVDGDILLHASAGWPALYTTAVAGLAPAPAVPASAPEYARFGALYVTAPPAPAPAFEASFDGAPRPLWSAPQGGAPPLHLATRQLWAPLV